MFFDLFYVFFVLGFFGSLLECYCIHPLSNWRYADNNGWNEVSGTHSIGMACVTYVSKVIMTGNET